jgi:sec-independent protein translocase protein TatA
MGLENPVHIAFVLMIMLLVFGAKRLPEMGRGLGSGMRGFKDALSGVAAPELPTPDPGASPSPAAADQPTLIQTGTGNE